MRGLVLVDHRIGVPASAATFVLNGDVVAPSGLREKIYVSPGSWMALATRPDRPVMSTSSTLFRHWLLEKGTVWFGSSTEWRKSSLSQTRTKRQKPQWIHILEAKVLGGGTADAHRFADITVARLEDAVVIVSS